MWGKHRGTVADVSDPLRLGRIAVMVPSVAHERRIWALPCFPSPALVLIPPVGSDVWVEFESGDVDRPIWTGCFFSDLAQVPDAASRASSDQTAGGVVIATQWGAFIAIDDHQLTIANGKGASITLEGPTVSINHDALSVT